MLNYIRFELQKVKTQTGEKLKAGGETDAEGVETGAETGSETAALLY